MSGALMLASPSISAFLPGGCFGTTSRAREVIGRACFVLLMAADLMAALCPF